MRIRELSIENFRKFRQLTVLTGFDEGLNLVCEPNETGKSTVLEALRAVLFERYSAKNDRIRSYRPYGDEVAPTISLTFEIHGERWTVKKRFLQNPSVQLEGPGGRLQSDAAEEKLQALLGFARAGNRGADDESRGALGLLWVEQGAWSLSVPGQTARKTLEDVLAGEIGAMTGGRRTTAVLQSIDKRLADLVTTTGKPTRRLQEAHASFEAAKTGNAQARDELAHFENTLSRLESKRQELGRLDRDLHDPETTHQGEQLEKDLVRARAAAQELTAAELRLGQASAARKAFEDRVSLRGRLVTSVAAAHTKVRQVRSRIEAHADTLTQAQQLAQQSGESLETMRVNLRQAEADRDAAFAVQRENLRQDHLRRAFARLDQSSPLAARLQEQAELIKANSVTVAVLRGLEELEQSVQQADAAARAGAAVFRARVASPVTDARLNGAPVTGDTEISVTTRLAFELPGLVSIEIEPPATGESARTKHEAATRDRDNALARLNLTSVADARNRARERTAAEQAVATLRSQVNAICTADADLGIPAGFEALRDALSRQQRPSAVGMAASAGQAGASLSESEFQALRGQERAAEARREAASQALNAAELQKVQNAADLAREAGEENRLQAELYAEIAAMGDTALDDALAMARQEEARLTVDLATARRATEGLNEADLKRKQEIAARRQKKLQEDRIGVLQEIARLEVEAKTQGGSGPFTRAKAAQEELQYAQASYEKLREEADTLQLLKTVLTDARQEAARRYLAPITARIQPYVQRLLPTASLSLGEDYRPGLLTRAGREEAADDLSKGTQEQLAVLTRLAFADLLLEKGKPASLVLDDALVFADDNRFETMTDILAEAAARMQVIILSCRTSAYRRVDGRKIQIS